MKNVQVKKVYNLAEAIDTAAERIRPIIHGGRVNKAYSTCLFTRVNKHLFIRQSGGY